MARLGEQGMSDCLLVDGGFVHGENWWTRNRNASGLLCAVSNQLRAGAGNGNPLVKLRQSSEMPSEGAGEAGFCTLIGASLKRIVP